MDYHDFVIKDGCLIGEFEQMYQKSLDVPWHQDQQENCLDVRLAVELIQEYGPFDVICDFGCGLGYFLNVVAEHCGGTECVLYGYDISQTACIKGRSIFPDISFHCFDLMHKYPDFQLDELRKSISDGDRRLFMLRGTLWYVFPHIAYVVNNLQRIIDPKDLFLVSQNFPPLTTNFVGKEAIPDPSSILGLFKRDFKPLRTIWLENKLSSGNDNWFIAIMQKL